MFTENLEEKVIQWAEEKGIMVAGNQTKQCLKMASEAGELCDAVAKNDVFEVEDAIGDVMVTLILLSKMYNLSLNQCLETAYNVIAKRTGKTVDGIFIKDLDEGTITVTSGSE